MKMTVSILVFLLPVTAMSAAEKIDLSKGRDHWAFQPVKKPALPSVKNKAWVRNPIDRFILARLEKVGLQPAPPAVQRNLQRRLHYALTGLPSSGSADIDKLMATPQYGERWARHWLDVVRYADSNGLDENAAHANAWRYRDYVVASFNADKPFDQFLIEQIAGDLLPAKDETRRREQRIATGFLSLGPKVLAEPDKMKMEMDIIDEQIDTLGRALLGLTLGCARCHDHKFDPIPTADYYALAGIFKSTKTMDSLKTIAKWHEHSFATPAQKELKKKHDALIAAQKKVVSAFTDKANQQLLVDLKLKTLPPSPEEKYSKANQAELAKLNATLKRLEADVFVLPGAMGVGHREIVVLQIAVARTPQHCLGRGKIEHRPLGLGFVIADERRLEAGLVGGGFHLLKLRHALVSQRHAQRSDLSPARLGLRLRLHLGEGLDRPHRQLDTIDAGAHLADQTGRLRGGLRGECVVFL